MKKCVQEAVSDDDKNGLVGTSGCSAQNNRLRHGSLIFDFVVRVRTLRSFPVEDFILWVSEAHGEKSKPREAVQLVVCCLWWAVRLEGGEQGTDDPSKQGGGRLGLQNTCCASGKCAPDQRLGGCGELAGDGDLHQCRVRWHKVRQHEEDGGGFEAVDSDR